MPLLEPLHETICVPHHGSDLQVIQLKAQLRRVKKSYQKYWHCKKKIIKIKKTHTQKVLNRINLKFCIANSKPSKKQGINYYTKSKNELIHVLGVYVKSSEIRY